MLNFRRKSKNDIVYLILFVFVEQVRSGGYPESQCSFPLPPLKRRFFLQRSLKNYVLNKTDTLIGVFSFSIFVKFAATWILKRFSRGCNI